MELLTELKIGILAGVISTLCLTSGCSKPAEIPTQTPQSVPEEDPCQDQQSQQSQQNQNTNNNDSQSDEVTSDQQDDNPDAFALQAGCNSQAIRSESSSEDEPSDGFGETVGSTENEVETPEEVPPFLKQYVDPAAKQICHDAGYAFNYTAPADCEPADTCRCDLDTTYPADFACTPQDIVQVFTAAGVSGVQNAIDAAEYELFTLDQCATITATGDPKVFYRCFRLGADEACVDMDSILESEANEVLIKKRVFTP